MPLVAQNAPPSTLADVIGQVADAFGEMGNATPIQVGKAYLESFGLGAPPKVLFVPDQRGSIGPARELGAAARITHGCDVYVRGEESGDDIERFRAAYTLAGIVISCISVAGGVFGGPFEDASPTDVDAHGAELRFSFTYARDVWHSAARWALDPATADTSGAVPAPPPGEIGEIGEITVTVTPTEEEAP